MTSMDKSASFTGPGGRDPLQVIKEILVRNLPGVEDMERAGAGQISRIRERTQAGVDINGRQFARYSRRHAAARAKLGLRVSPPNLRMSGRLLDSLNVEVRDTTSFAIVITDPEARSYGAANHFGTGRIPSRPFLGSNQNDIVAIFNDLRPSKVGAKSPGAMDEFYKLLMDE
jgi:phage gpG-like protein